MSAGNATVRLPARDFGVSVSRPPVSSWRERLRDPDLAASRSMLSRRRAGQFAPAHVAKVASRTSARYRAGTARASSKTTGSGTICRSSDSSLPAPSMWQGLRRMMHRPRPPSRRWRAAGGTPWRRSPARTVALPWVRPQPLLAPATDVASSMLLRPRCAEGRLQMVLRRPVGRARAVRGFSTRSVIHCSAYARNFGFPASGAIHSPFGSRLPSCSASTTASVLRSKVRERTELAVRPPVAGLVSARWKLADAAELSALFLGARHQATSPRE